jgi:hypothetical protein
VLGGLALLALFDVVVAFSVGGHQLLAGTGKNGAGSHIKWVTACLTTAGSCCDTPYDDVEEEEEDDSAVLAFATLSLIFCLMHSQIQEKRRRE